MSFRTEENWIRVYQDKCALWIHDGNPKRPHALLSSGKHSTGFFNSRLVVSDGQLLREAASDLVDSIETGINIGKIDRVVGPETGATKLAEFISDEIGGRRNYPCTWASPAEVEYGRNKSMIFSDPKRTVLSGETVLLCDDVLTTGGNVELATTAVINAGGIVLTLVVAIVNRSDLKYINGKETAALIVRPMPAWFPEECLLCPQGSKPLLPKSENWALLNAEY